MTMQVDLFGKLMQEPEIIRTLCMHNPYCTAMLYDKEETRWVSTGCEKPELDCVENSNPSCHRCNNWKRSMDIETFRSEIAEQVTRVRRDSCGFRMAEDFGMKVIECSVVFYFETFSTLNI